MFSGNSAKIAVGFLTLMFLIYAGSPIVVSVSTTANSAQLYHPNAVVMAAPNPDVVTCGEPYPKGLCPNLLLTAYDVTALQSAGATGAGQTVVIVDACGSPTIASDLHEFDLQFGLTDPTLNVVNVQGTPCSNTGWAEEVSLDVEWAHVMAPGATIELLVAAQPTNADLFGAWTYSLSHSLGNQISNSWGGSSSCSSNAKNILSTAASDHVTVLASTGDNGYWGKGTPNAAQSPADCKNILAVGGTTLTIKASGAYVSESAWGSSCISGTGTGGGYATGTSEPGYQSKALITDSYGLLGRPDVSAVADPCTGVWIYYSGSWLVIGGTSLACPLWAGFMADVNQIRTTNGFNAAGLINSFLYKKIYGVSGGGANYHSDFHDVTTGSNGWPAGTGWDAATGIGSFDANNLAQTLGSNAAAGINSTA